MTASIILMAALLKKYSIAPTFKNAVVSLRSKKKNICYLELADIYLQVMKSIFLIIPNY